MDPAGFRSWLLTIAHNVLIDDARRATRLKRFAPEALEMPRGLRINVVSPPWVKETLVALGMDSSGGMPAEKVAQAYRASLSGTRSGTVINARDFA